MTKKIRELKKQLSRALKEYQNVVKNTYDTEKNEDIAARALNEKYPFYLQAHMEIALSMGFDAQVFDNPNLVAFQAGTLVELMCNGYPEVAEKLKDYNFSVKKHYAVLNACKMNYDNVFSIIELPNSHFRDKWSNKSNEDKSEEEIRELLGEHYTVYNEYRDLYDNKTISAADFKGAIDYGLDPKWMIRYGYAVKRVILNKALTNGFSIIDIQAIYEALSCDRRVVHNAGSVIRQLGMPRGVFRDLKKFRQSLKFTENQTPEICLNAVKINGNELEFVKEQTPEICMAAVKQDGLALKFVKEQTAEICMAAIQKNAFALEFVKEQTHDICLEAINNDGKAYKFIKEQTPELSLAAVKRADMLEYVDEQTPEICLAAVERDGGELFFVKEQTLEICLAAVKQYDRALAYVKPEFEGLCKKELNRLSNMDNRNTLTTSATF